MKKKSTFTQIMILVAIACMCIVTTVSLALLAGSLNITLFDWKNLNFSNMIPVLIIGGFLTCVIVGIAILFFSRSIFHKVRNYLFENHESEGEQNK